MSKQVIFFTVLCLVNTVTVEAFFKKDKKIDCAIIKEIDVNIKEEMKLWLSSGGDFRIEKLIENACEILTNKKVKNECAVSSDTIERCEYFLSL